MDAIRVNTVKELYLLHGVSHLPAGAGSFLGLRSVRICVMICENLPAAGRGDTEIHTCPPWQGVFFNGICGNLRN